MNKPKPNWDDKRPGVAEQISSRLSVKSAFADNSPGGLPSLTNEEFAGVLGSMRRPMYRILLGARYAGWRTELEQLKEIVLRRSWSAWREKHRQGSFTIKLNQRMADLTLYVWAIPIDDRPGIGDTYRASKLKVGYRRYRNELREHHLDLVAWLDVETANALDAVRRALRG